MTIELRPDDGIDSTATRDVIRALAATGDYSKLDDAQRGDVIRALCAALRLNPFAKPFEFIRLNGKLVLYATRGATDQLAAVHRVNRRIVRGPEIVDLLGKKTVLAVCEATLPNGRVEQSTATCDAADQCGVFNVLMKTETKAKRRATLAILGLAVLDEMEATDAGAVPDVRLAVQRTPPQEEPAGSRAFAAFVLRLASIPTVAALLDAYHSLVADLREEGHDPAEFLADGADPAALGAASLVGQRVHALGHRLAKVDLTALLTDGGERIAAGLDSQAEALAGKVGVDARVALVEWWRAHRAELAGDKPAAKVLFGALVRRWDGSDEPPDGPRTKRSRAELERALSIADQDAGRTAEPASASAEARKVREVLPGTEAEIRAHVGRYGHPRAIESAARKYAPAPALHRALAERLQALTPPDADGTRLTDRGALLQVEAWSVSLPRERRTA